MIILVCVYIYIYIYLLPGTRCNGKWPGQCYESNENQNLTFCKDKSDQISWLGISDNSSEFCKDNSSFLCESKTLCVHESLVCDGSNQCPDFSDEKNCVAECFGATFVHKMFISIYPLSKELSMLECIGYLVVGLVSTIMFLLVFGFILIGFLKTFRRVPEGFQSSSENWSEDAKNVFIKKFLKMKSVNCPPLQGLSDQYEVFNVLETFPIEDREFICRKVGERLLKEDDKGFYFQFLLGFLGTNKSSQKFMDYHDQGCFYKLAKTFRKLFKQETYTRLAYEVAMFQLILWTIAFLIDYYKDMMTLAKLGSISRATDTFYIISRFPFFIFTIYSLSFGFSIIITALYSTVAKTGAVVEAPFVYFNELLLILKSKESQFIKLNTLTINGSYFENVDKTEKVKYISQELRSAQLASYISNLNIARYTIIEISVEHVVQSLILSLLTVLTMTETSTVEFGHMMLKDFDDEVNRGSSTMLICLAAISVFRIPRGYVGYTAAYMYDFFPFKASLVSHVYFGLHVFTRLSAILFCMAPCLGLFDLLFHWQETQITWKEDLNNHLVLPNGTAVHSTHIWAKQHYTVYSGLTKTWYAAIFFLLVFLHFILTFMIKRTFSMHFKQKLPEKGKLSNRFWHVLAQFISPLFSQDWSDKKTLVDKQKCWLEIRNEFWAMHFLFFIENLLLCIPIFCLYSAIEGRNEHLGQFLPPELDEIHSTKRINFLVWFAPTLVGSSALLSHLTLYFYYYYCHPWAQLFRIKIKR